MVFLRAADGARPLTFALEELSAGRTFTTLAVRVEQDGRRCAGGTVLLDATAPDVIRHAVAPPDVPGPYESEPYDMAVTGRDIRMVHGAYTDDPGAPAGPPTLDAWVRFRNVPDDGYLHAALLAQFTGHLSIAAALRPHEGHRSARGAPHAVDGDQCHRPLAARRRARRPLDALPAPLDLRGRRHDACGVPGARRDRRPARLLHRGRHGAPPPADDAPASDERTAL